jgi:hypothetical protein
MAMNYAVLVLTNTTYAQQMKEIARCVTGLVSTTADLLFADKATSSVTINDSTATGKWTLNTTLTPLEAGTTATAVGYIFSAPCQVSSKTKYGVLYASTGSYLSGSWSSPYGLVLGSGTGLVNASTLPTTYSSYATQIATLNGTGLNSNGTWWGQSWQVSNSGVTSGVYVLTNQSPNPAATGTSQVITGYPFNSQMSTTANKLYLFWNSSGIIMTVNGQVIQAIGEYPETTVTTQKSNIPVFCFGGNTYAIYGSGNIVSAQSGNAINTSAMAFNNMYSVSDSLNSYRYTGIRSTNNTFVNPTLDAAGNQLTPLAPLLSQLYQYGQGVINCSSLVPLYQTVSGAAAHGDALTVGSSRLIALNSTFGTYAVKVN